MEPEWFAYLCETRPDLAAAAERDSKYSAEWRDRRIADLEAENQRLREHAGRLYRLLDKQRVCLGLVGTTFMYEIADALYDYRRDYPKEDSDD